MPYEIKSDLSLQIEEALSKLEELKMTESHDPEVIKDFFCHFMNVEGAAKLASEILFISERKSPKLWMSISNQPRWTFALKDRADLVFFISHGGEMTMSGRENLDTYLVRDLSKDAHALHYPDKVENDLFKILEDAGSDREDIIAAVIYYNRR